MHFLFLRQHKIHTTMCHITKFFFSLCNHKYKMEDFLEISFKNVFKKVISFCWDLRSAVSEYVLEIFFINEIFPWILLLTSDFWFNGERGQQVQKEEAYMCSFFTSEENIFKIDIERLSRNWFSWFFMVSSQTVWEWSKRKFGRR